MGARAFLEGHAAGPAAEPVTASVKWRQKNLHSSV